MLLKNRSQQPLISLFVIALLGSSCSLNNEQKSKGITANQPIEESDTNGHSGNNQHARLETRPSNVVLTGYPEHRLVTIYKINYNSGAKNGYIGNNNFHRTYSDISPENLNQWHGHFMPGFEALFGYDLFNIAHYDVRKKQKQLFFENYSLINTVYFPSLLQDTLGGKPVLRSYYMVSVYDEDTNKDNLINRIDLRRFYRFDLDGLNKTPLTPKDYSVLSSEYDHINDIMFVFAKHDENLNGKTESEEPVHIFSIDLKQPHLVERLY